MRALVLVVDGEGEVLHIQGDAITEDHHHEQRAEQGESQAHLVAQQFLAFAGGDGEQALEAEAAAQVQRRCVGWSIELGADRRRFAGSLSLFQAGDEGVFKGLATKLLLQRRRGIAGQDLAGMHQGNPVAAQRFVHEVGGEEDRHPLVSRQLDQQAPEIIAGGGIDA
ncbi:hypothetical protein D3C80_1229220 [compost metagenome]